mmetsp:Transcript_69337/g.123507  ORF Transcript_69337/g.123507 Transcript_69337/m.123507 type:complete len:198 (-) Transcript_69337:77-670(-)
MTASAGPDRFPAAACSATAAGPSRKRAARGHRNSRCRARRAGRVADCRAAPGRPEVEQVKVPEGQNLPSPSVPSASAAAQSPPEDRRLPPLPEVGSACAPSATAAPTSVAATAPLARHKSVRFELDLSTLHEITPYAEIYGLHPREFNFDRSYHMVPAFAFNPQACFAEADSEDCAEDSDDDDDQDDDDWTSVCILD